MMVKKQSFLFDDEKFHIGNDGVSYLFVSE